MPDGTPDARRCGTWREATAVSGSALRTALVETGVLRQVLCTLPVAQRTRLDLDLLAQRAQPFSVVLPGTVLGGESQRVGRLPDPCDAFTNLGQTGGSTRLVGLLVHQHPQFTVEL